MFNEDLFQGTSFSDLLPTSPDVSMSYYNLSDDEPLGLPSMLPNLMTPQISPTNDSVNILDMIRQDVMLGNGLQSSMNSASTEVTYASQYSRYSTPSAVPFTSAGDVFLPTIPITTASNTFIKPMDTFVKPAYLSRTATMIMKPNSRTASPNSPNQIAVSPFVLDDEPVVSSPRTTATRDSDPAKCRNLSSRTSSKKKKSSRRSHGSHSHSKSSSRKSKQSSRSRSKGQSLLLINSPPQRAFVPTSTRADSSRSTAATHMVTRAANTASKSTPAFNTGMVSSTIATVAQNVSKRTADDAFKTSTTCHHTSYMASSASYSPNTYSSVNRFNYSTTCSVTSHTISGPRTPVSIISPMQASYDRSASTLNSTPTNTSRVPPCATRTTGKSLVSSDLLELSSTQPSFAIPATNAGLVSHSGTGDTLLRSRLTMLSPYACASSPETTCVATATKTSNATVKPRISHTGRIIRTPYSVTHVNTSTTATTPTTTTAASRTMFTQNTFAFAPGTTLYAARKVPSTKGSRSVAETTESQIFAIAGGKASYLTIPSDFTTTSTSIGAAQSPTVTAGVGSHVLSTVPDSTTRPRNQILFSIANSHMNTTSSLGYLVTSPVGSEIITSRNTATSSQDATTGAAAILGSHTITALTPEALSKLRNTLLSATHVPSTAGGLSSVSAPTMSTDANRTRGPVTILSNQLITTVNPCDSTNTLKSPRATNMTPSTRTLFSGTPTQGLYTITTGGTSHSPSTTAVEPAARQINRMIMSILPNVHATSNSQGSASTSAVASNINTRAFSVTPSQTTYFIAPSMPAGDRTRASRLAYGIPIFQSSIATTAALTSATVASPSFPGSIDGTASYTLPTGTANTQSKLRNRLTGHVTTTDAATPGTTAPITAYTYSRTRAQQNVYTFPARPVMYAPSTEPSEISSGNSSMALITLTTTSVATPTTNSPQTVPAAHGDPPSPTTQCSITTATPTITNTGSHYTIKLAATNELATASKSTVTAAVTTPITAASLSPPEHSFMEHHHPVSRLRTFPGPRTYSVAQRSAAGSGQQRPSASSVAPRTAKKVIANPAPLQIFADVVCPPPNAQPTAPTISVHPKPPFKLSHSSGSSTLVVPQYKNTDFKNLSTVAHANPERLSSRLLTPRSSSERLVLNRSVALVGPPPILRRHAMVGPVLASPTGSHRTFARSQRTSRLVGRTTPSVVEADTTIDLPSSPDEDQDE